MRIYEDHDGRIVTAVHTRSAASPSGDNANMFIIKHGEGQTGLPFQNGQSGEHGVNGLSTEALLAALIHRTRVLDEHLQCPENALALTAMQQALDALELRSAKRRLARLSELDRV